MEKKVDGEHMVGEMEKRVEDVSLGLEVKDDLKCCEENEVFEEAMDGENSCVLNNQDSVNGDGNGEAEVEASEGLADDAYGGGRDAEDGVQIDDELGDVSGQKMQGVNESESVLEDGDDEGVLFSDSNGYEEKIETLKESVYLTEGDEKDVETRKLNSDQSAEKQDVHFGEKIDSLHESEANHSDRDSKEASLAKGDDGKAEDAVGEVVEAAVVDDEKDDNEISESKSVNEGSDEKGCSCKPQNVENGEAPGLNSNGIGLVHETESKKQNSHETEAVLQQIQDAPVSLNQHATNMKSADLAQIDGEIEAISPPSVAVEDLDNSGFSDDEDSRITSGPAPNVTSSHHSTGGPSLPSRPAGLGTSAPLPEHTARALQHPRVNGATHQNQPLPSEEASVDDVEESKETQEKLQMIRVKFLRLAHRLGQTPHNVVVAQVLYRLGLAEQLWRNTNRTGVFSFDQASVMAEQLEAAGQEPLDFSCTIMVIGKSGVGKSATINSIFDEVKFSTDAFQLGTKKVQDVVGTVQGIKVRVIDTPGLSSSSSDQHQNEKILHSVKRFISKSPPDIVLYFDRLDMQSRDHGDVPLLRSITNIFGPSIWFNAIVVLTHAASAPPDGPNGAPLSYEMFVTQRSHVVQQAIRQAAGDLRLMNPVSLVENHTACRMNRAGQRVLPNGLVWKPQLLLLSFASKILAEANLLLKLQDNPPGKPFGSRARVPPLPFLLSSLLQSRPQLKLPEEQFGEEDSLDDDLDDASDSGDEADYDELPPFKRLTKAQLANLSKAQRKAYFEELEYREKLFFKKQLKEERMRRKLLKKTAEAAKDMPSEHNNENLEEESSGPASVPVPMPDLVLPTSFDSDNPTHRYRFLDSSNPWLVRPVLETHGWDHDVGYEGLNVERLFVLKDKIPISVSGQFTKDKKESTVQMELSTSLKHGEKKATSYGLDVQTVGKDMMYTLRTEMRFNNIRRNDMVAGLTVTQLGDTVSAGLKVEDKLIVNKRFKVLMSGGAMTGRGDVAYGGRLEATLKDQDYPIGRALSTLALSVVDWHGDLAVGCNLQSQIPIGRGTNLIGHANISNRGSGQLGIRFNSSEQLQIALLALIPIFRNVKKMLSGSSQSM
ncbi:LOW QUALITY PROTEIN: translocase of chloroplast 120, chloroplastic-like [Dioscorea cayenensis subsp. rotundata]|uniref:LOW QUALITY PROTEIN: translocase of chloroplast 120, chloroplastic-like n=1 Tax=Dioscorea cayennensis subsp. rotundata TaxID=55577 RepID=A0AB40CDG6_DIOCR|nr:LOW QUALITY PROTEIN: translocase of chloroplast 120, chloroplastic-like [Dioscorea cayenensis subsp. rotundata]